MFWWTNVSNIHPGKFLCTPMHQRVKLALVTSHRATKSQKVAIENLLSTATL